MTALLFRILSFLLGIVLIIGLFALMLGVILVPSLRNNVLKPLVCASGELQPRRIGEGNYVFECVDTNGNIKNVTPALTSFGFTLASVPILLALFVLQRILRHFQRSPKKKERARWSLGDDGELILNEKSDHEGT